MVKHPTYIRHSLQIRERCGFESRQVYQFIFAIVLFISTPTIANVQSNTIIHECFAKFDTYMKVANCITVTRNEIQRKKNAEQWEFLKANPRYRFPGRSWDKCFGQEKELVVDRVETTKDKVVVHYKKSIKPCIRRKSK